MTATDSQAAGSLAAYYWHAYLDWRAEYGVGDECMSELVAAMKAELQKPNIARDEVANLQKLAAMIEAEMTLMDALTKNKCAA